MNTVPEQGAATPFDLGPGLTEFYSSQATLMLSQYQNVERLLGPTDDWTAPGTHCEILLRNFLRAYLPSRYSADKGFIYGRRQVGTETKHSPEIDILVHNTHDFRPLFQMEDFVIVQATAAHAAIQVKRRMDNEKLRSGLVNVLDSKKHRTCQLDYPDSGRFASAVVFFDEKNPGSAGKPSVTYRNCITEIFADQESWEFAPDFVGSLQHCFYRRSSYGINDLEYTGYPAHVGQHNIAVQLLLWIFTHLISGHGTHPPMPAVPAMMKSLPVDSFQITKENASVGREQAPEGGAA